MRNKKVTNLVVFSALLAIEIIIAFTPFGSIPIGPIVATLGHIPVIIAAITMGTGAGVLMGFFFGLLSLIYFTFIAPSPVSMLFSPFISIGEYQGNFYSLIIVFVPRILVGFVCGKSLKFFKKVFTEKKKYIAYLISGVLATLTNTFLVLGGIYVFFGVQYATLINQPYAVLLGFLGLTVLTQGVPESIIGALCARFIGQPLERMISREDL